MDLFAAVESFTQVITYVMILSGIPPCFYMLKTGITKGFPYPFFLVNIVNACLGIGYGRLLENGAIIQINTVAAIVVGLYLISFVYTSTSKLRPMFLLALCCLVLGSIYFYINFVVEKHKITDSLGMFLLILSTVLLSTPLIQVESCIEEKSAEDLSLSMLVAGTLCSSSWLTYGYLLNDINIYFPNIIGVAVNLCQMVALTVYGRETTTKAHTA